MHELTTNRVIVIGAGLGALYAALALAPYPVLMISPDPLGQGASSAWAQGGVAAAMAENDSSDAHAADTIRAGAGTVDKAVAAVVTTEARDHILDLTALGAPFDRDDAGGFVLSREAAHSVARVVRVKGDQAGAEIMRALVAQVRASSSIQVLEGVMATALRSEAGRVTGVTLALASPDGSEPVQLSGAAYLLAGGGSGGLFSVTTNPARICGQPLGLAARAGVVISDPEFVQFHPTAIDVGHDPAPLATEALRGEGAVLINSDGARFMVGQHPDAELAPRDIVARAVYAEAQAGRRPMLDTREVLGDRLLTAFPAVARACLSAGLNPVSEAIPITAAAHYHIGGVETDMAGRSSLPGLWVVGETASTGLHGANRLASNGLLEALVFARRAANDIARSLPPVATSPEVHVPALSPGTTPDPELVARLRRAMTDGVGVIRTAQGLSRALAEIAEVEAAQPDCPQLCNMTATATLIAAAALIRRESRGAHFRADYPMAQGETGKRSRLTLADALRIRANAETETA